MSLFADVIVDISQESLDRPFQYRIPVDLAGVSAPERRCGFPLAEATGRLPDM